MKSATIRPVFAVMLATLATAAAALDVDAKRKPSDKAWKPQPTRLVSDVTGFKPSEPTHSPYGGRTDRKAKATGFFHAEQVNGRWWLVDPEGCLMLSVGCCSVSLNRTENGRAALQKKFGSEERWADATLELLAANGFNTLACWSDAKRLPAGKPKMAYTVILNFMSSYGKKRGGTYQKPGHTGYPNDCIFALDPEFPSFCEKHAREHLAPLKDDPWLLGIFSDNEMPFPANALDKFLALPAGDAGRQAAESWLAARGGKKDNAAFLEHLAEAYFRAVHAAIRKVDPNHMYFGPRFHGSDRTKPELWRAAGRYLDVVSMNYYGAWTPDAESLSNWVKWSGKPFMITEWYAKGADSGFANTSGAGWLVKTQKDRGAFYQNFTLGLLKHPGCVGWHWFKYMDNDTTDKRADPSNVDSNKGIVTNVYEPYKELLSAMKELNQNVYGLADHFGRKHQ
jgi:hypothetical protein